MAFYHEMLTGLGDLLHAPFDDPSALWMLAPIFLIWFMLEIYFGIHKRERIGWNTALGNGITMFWITVELMRHLFKNSFEYFSLSKFIAVLILLMYGIFIAYISFKHKYPDKVAYALASPTFVYYFCGVVILWTYGSIEATFWVIVDIILLFAIILSLVKWIKHLIPEALNDGKVEGPENLTPKDDGLPPVDIGSDQLDSDPQFSSEEGLPPLK